jgi:Uma2 family endonuclease
MGVTTALLTVEQYAQLPEEETMRTELVEGEIVRMGDAKLLHELIKSNCSAILIEYVLRNPLGKVFGESMYKLGPREARIPDVTLLSNERLVAQDLNGFLTGAPDLAFEVVSSESAAFLERKINLFLANGCRTFWVAYPLERTISIRRAEGKPEYLHEGHYLEEPDLLPAFRVMVDRFFDGI